MLITGDTSTIKEMISGLPITIAQKKLMTNMLDGNMDSVMDNVAELVGPVHMCDY